MSAISDAKALVDDTWDHLERWIENMGEAERILRAELIDHPTDVTVLTALGAVLCDDAKYGEAISVLKEAVRLGSTDANTYFNLGVAMMNFDLFRNDAKTYFEQAARLQPSPATWEAYFDPQAH